MAVALRHMNQTGLFGDERALAPDPADPPAMIADAAAAVDLAREAWDLAEPIQRDAARAWRSHGGRQLCATQLACVSVRDMLPRMAREGAEVTAPPP